MNRLRNTFLGVVLTLLALPIVFIALNQTHAQAACYRGEDDASINAMINDGGERPVAPDYAKNAVKKALQANNECTAGFAFTDPSFTTVFLGAYVGEGNVYANKRADSVTLIITSWDSGYSFGRTVVALGEVGKGKSKAGSIPMGFDNSTLFEGSNERCFRYEMRAVYGGVERINRDGSFCNTWYKPPPATPRGNIQIIKAATPGSLVDDSQINACLNISFVFINTQQECTGTRPSATFDKLPILSEPLSYSVLASANPGWNIKNIIVFPPVGMSKQTNGSFVNPVQVFDGQKTVVMVVYEKSSTPTPANLSVTCQNGNIVVNGSGFDSSFTLADINIGTNVFDANTNFGKPGATNNHALIKPLVGGAFSATFPTQNFAKTPPNYLVYIFKNDPKGDPNIPSINESYPGSPFAVNDCAPPPAVFYPWLQTKQGDVISRSYLRGQDTTQPGGRGTYHYAESISASATTGITSPNTGAATLIDDPASVNPAKKALRLSGDRNLAQVTYSGAITAVTARLRAESFAGDTAGANFTLRVRQGNTIISETPGNVRGSYAYSSIFFFRDDNGSSNNIPRGGPFTVEVSFDNDSFTPGQDRNLVVDQLIVYGEVLSGPEATYAEISPVAVNDANANFFCSLNQYVVGKLMPAAQCQAGGYSFSHPNAGTLAKISNSLSVMAARGGNKDANGACLVGVSSSISFRDDIGGSNCRDGMIYARTGNTTLSSRPISKGRATLWVKNGDLNITGNITNSFIGSYTNPSQLPNLAIVVEGGNINIGPGVDQVDAILIAKDGKINTCTGGDTNSAAGVCARPLLIQGYLASLGRIEFGRRAFSWDLPNQNPAEQIILSGQSVAFPPPGVDMRDDDLNSQLRFRSGEFAPRLR